MSEFEQVGAMLPAGPGRLLFDPPASGPWNMAADEILLENAERGEWTLRFYHWEGAVVSLGYFQELHARSQHPSSAACALVRRSTGGGALIHDGPAHDLTYSVALPEPERNRSLTNCLYFVLHQAFVAWAQTLAIPAYRFAGEESPTHPFLCFQRHTHGDVLVNGHKILGSAQRRGRSARLQHGSLLIRQTPAAPELPGLLDLADVASRSVAVAGIADAWRESLGAFWPITWEKSSWTAEEQRRIAARIAEKYAHPAWTAKR